MIAYIHTFRVVAYHKHVKFPVDMLRYDGCYPVEGSNIVGYAQEDIEAGMTVTMHKVWDKGWRPTTERWASFGWGVVMGSHECYKL